MYLDSVSQKAGGFKAVRKTEDNRWTIDVPVLVILELPGLNHLFQTCRTGAVSEYIEIDETVAPVVTDRIVAWIRKLSP